MYYPKIRARGYIITVFPGAHLCAPAPAQHANHHTGGRHAGQEPQEALPHRPAPQADQEQGKILGLSPVIHRLSLPLP